MLIYLQSQAVFSQNHLSKDNYTGAWETPSSWDPAWTAPQTTDIEGINIIINGYITVNGPLSFSGSLSNLIINDTLVINGDLLLGSFNNLTVNGNGILIIRGNLTLDYFPNIITNNYIVITGYIWKLGSINNGSFISNSNPAKVFVGAYIYPTAITNKPNFPALNCTAPIATPYSHSKCSYGDMTDLINDPINTFIQSACTMTAAITITDNSGIANNDGIICNGATATITATGGTSYSWSSGETTASIFKGTSGTYTVTVTNANDCTDTEAAAITVNALPVVAITITDNSGIANNDGIISNGAIAILTASGGTSYSWSSGETTAAITKGTEGTYTVIVTNANGCANEASAEVVISVYDPFIPSVITPNGDGKNDYLKISEIIGQVELIIFNRWGNEEYTNRNYSNDWDGRNNKGAELPNDTYFYILKFDNVNIKKGSVLIKR